jgi:long-chain acyl-CoA synthetase
MKPATSGDTTVLRSLVAAQQRQVELRGAAPALRYRRAGNWHAMSWLEWQESSRALAAALIGLGIQPGDHVAILANTGVEWVLVDLAIQMAGAVTVPIYASCTAEQIAFLLRDCDAQLVFCENLEQLQKVAQKRAELPALGRMLCLQSAPEPVWQTSLEPGFVRRALWDQPEFIPSWQQLLALGRSELERSRAELRERAASLGRETLALLSYTSGTTGTPKGVQLTHGNLLWTAAASVANGCTTPEDEALLLLPVAHIYGRHCLTLGVLTGAVTALDADLPGLSEHCRAVRPTILPAVPRLYEKLAAALQGAPASVVQQALGGRIRLLISGGALLAPAVAQFFADAGLPIMEGYGLTECSAGAVVSPPGVVRVGSVGRPLDGVELRIAPDGEVLISSPGVMRGYHRRPEESVAALEVLDGKTWLRTGDVGHLDADGYLWLTDRKKDLFKTSGAKYVAPQQLENLLQAQSRLVSQVAICGDGRHFVSALITLDEAALARHAREHSLDESYAELTRDPSVLAALQVDVDTVNARLAPFEAIKKFRVLPRDFTLAAGELTPTVKLCRRVIAEKHRALIEEMYAS